MGDDIRYRNFRSYAITVKTTAIHFIYNAFAFNIRVIYLSLDDRRRVNKMFWASLTVVTVIVMAFIYLTIYIRESNYLFPIY